MKVFVSSKSFGKTNPDAVAFLESHGFEIRRCSNINPTEEDIIKEIDDAEVLIVGNDPVGASVFDADKKLRLVVMNGTGVDAIDVKEATKRGILIANAPGANRNAVAEMAVCLMLTLGRRIDTYEACLKAGKWERQPGHEISGSVLGILGLGNIGKRVVELLSGFDIRVVAYDPFPDMDWVEKASVKLEKNANEVFATADYLVLTLPLNEQTYHIVNKETLSLMKKSSYVVNVARGGLVDEQALYDALSSKRIAGAALDTFDEEPLPQDSLLRKLDIVLTPHLAATSIETSIKVSQIVAQKIIAIIQEGHVELAINGKEIHKNTKKELQDD